MNFNSFKISFAAIAFIFMLNACKKEKSNISLPTISTLNATSITISSAITGGGITSDGNSAITAKGVCYSKTSYPNTDNTKTSDGIGSDQFTSAISSLDPGALYYIRAYATNSAGTAYGQQLTFQTLPLAIGDDFNGGKVAYILQAGDPNYSGDYEHGLVAAPADQPATDWGSYSMVGGTLHSIGTGNANTVNIVANLGNGTYAARVCADLVYPTAGYNDWYLPSIDEMLKLYLTRDIVGGFGAAYWTSSEYNNNLAWAFDFGIGTYVTVDKSVLNLVRPVRSF